MQQDEDIDLCKEYLREESSMEVLPSGDLTTVWSIDHQNSQILFEFSSTLCAGQCRLLNCNKCLTSFNSKS